MTLIDKEWIEEHQFNEVNGRTGATCIRCGQCCLTIPCFWAQMWHGLTKESDKCPRLELLPDGKYNCTMMKQNSTMRHEMLKTGCHYPEWRRE